MKYQSLLEKKVRRVLLRSHQAPRQKKVAPQALVKKAPPNLVLQAPLRALQSPLPQQVHRGQPQLVLLNPRLLSQVVHHLVQQLIPQNRVAPQRRRLTPPRQLRRHPHLAVSPLAPSPLVDRESRRQTRKQ